MYSTSGDLTSCVGFRGYVGGVEKSEVKDESDCASIGETMENVQMLERSEQCKRNVA